MVRFAYAVVPAGGDTGSSMIKEMMRMRRGNTRFRAMSVSVLCVVLLVVMAMHVGAAPSYPDPRKNVEFIVPWAAGGGTDVATRGYLRYAEKYIGSKIYVKNITGAASGVGTLELMHAKPDGYSMGTLTYDSCVTVPFFKLMQGYDLSKLEPLCVFTDHPFILCVLENSPWKNLNELVTDARNRPGKIKIGNVGAGGGSHVAALDFEHMAGVRFHHIAYPAGDAPQLEALLSKEVDAVITTTSASMAHRMSGRLRTLAVASAQPHKSLVNVPTFMDCGYDFVWGSFRAIAIPAGTAPEIVGHLEESFRKAFYDAEFQKWADERDIGQVWMGRAEAQKYIGDMNKAATAVMAQLVKEGILQAP